MTTNLILRELYETRSRILAEHGADLEDFMRCEFQRLESEGHPIARIRQRRIRAAEKSQGRTTKRS